MARQSRRSRVSYLLCPPVPGNWTLDVRVAICRCLLTKRILTVVSSCFIECFFPVKRIRSIPAIQDHQDKLL